MKQTYFSILLTTILMVSLQFSANAQNALQFDGINDFVTVPNASGLIANQNMSLSFWVYPTNPSPAYPNFDGMAGFRNNTTADFYILHLSTNSVEARFRNSSGTAFDIVYNGVNINTWNHFVMTYNGSMMTLYHNGVSVGTQAATGFITSTNQTLYMGTLPFSPTSFYLNGKLDDVCLWSKSLISSEAATLYNACSVDLNATDLELCYEFNQGIGGGNNTAITSFLDSKNNINGVNNGLAMTGTASNFVAYSNNAVTNIAANICGGTYTSPNGNSLSTTGIYRDTIAGGSMSGCDSIVVINLAVGNNSATTISPTACGSYNSPNGQVLTTSGTYTQTLTGFAGCDSVITINLSIGNTTTSTINVQACNSYTSPGGTDTWTTSGTYVDYITNAAGCDSIVTIHLTIANNTGTLTTQSCGNYTSPSGNHTWTTSGTYTDILTNVAGCDSVLTINLTINSTPNIAVTQNVHTLTATLSGATYQWLNCDNNTQIANETSQSFTPTVDGNYAVIITMGGCSDTSNCFNVMPVSTHEIFKTAIKAFPNPTTGQVQIDLGQSYADVKIQITDIVGRVVQTEFYNESHLINLEIQQPSGVYFLEITSDNQRVVLRILVD